MDNNWTLPQTKELFSLVEQANKSGKGLGTAFDKMSKKCGRSANSVRNFYYSQLKMFQLLPTLASDLEIKLPESKRNSFELFTDAEIRTLIENILVGKAAGKSVRAVIAAMAEGDSKRALRLQNKYRSMLTHHRAYVERVMDELKERDIAYYDPYRKKKKKNTDKDDNLKKLGEYISRLDEQEAGSFLQLIRKLI